MPYDNGPHERMLEKQQDVLAMVSQGMRIYEALRKRGVAIKTHEKWRQRYPEYATALDAARAAQLDRGEPWTGGFASFRKTFFGFDSPPFHLELISRLENAPGDSISMVLLPPNHGKTTLLTDWICYLVALDPNIRILILSESEGHSKKILGRIKRRMTDPVLAGAFIARFGPFYQDKQEKDGKPWTETHITVAKAQQDENDYTIEAKGWGSQIYGARFDYCLLDDVQSTKSLNLTESIIEKLTQDVVSRPDPGVGKIGIVGTRVGIRDFYITAQELDLVTEKCLMVKPAISFDGKPLWPDRWPIEALEKKRKQVTEKIWWRAYMQRPQDDGTATFAEWAINQCKDEQRSIGKRIDPATPKVASLDPALDGGCCLGVLEWGEQLALLDIEKRTSVANNEAIYSFVEEYHNRYGFNDLVIEAVAFQKGLARDERLRAMADRLGFRIYEHETNVNKISETYGVAAMAGAFQRREIVLPWGDPETAQRLEFLIAELIAWRPDIPTRYLVQDGVMVMWFAWKWWLQRRRRDGDDTGSEAFKSNGMPYTPTGIADLGRAERAYVGQRY